MSGRGFLESLLDAQLRVEVADGRRFVGTFVCTDRDGNAILNETQEWRGGTSLIHSLILNVQADTIEVDQRYVGLVVVPGRHIRKIEVSRESMDRYG